MLLRMAWRNLWRNPRRTALTAAAGVFAVALSLTSLALALGSHERWIDQVVRLYPGHIEVSLEGYRDNLTLDYGMTLPESGLERFEELPGLQGWAPRLETWALALPDRDDSVGRAAWLLGVEPARELAVSRLAGAVREGRFVEERGEAQVVIGATLARNLGVGIGDLVILLAGDYYGSQSADRFEVVGLFEVGDPRFDSFGALVPLATLQEFLVFPGGVSHVAFFAEKSQFTEPILERVAEVFPRDLHEILAWPELIPDFVQFMILDDLGNYLTLAILVTVVAFGLLNTILMSVFERVREFGVMRAVGACPRTVFELVVLESLLISAIGIAIGTALAVPGLLWLAEHPIPFSAEGYDDMFELFQLEPEIMFRVTARQSIGMAFTLLAVSVLAALPPAVRAARGRPVDALRET